MYYIRLLTVPAVFMACGCFGAKGGPSGRPVWQGSEPDWVTYPPAKYPKEKFLTGVGVGNTRSAAEKDARGELARIFRADVDSKVETYQKYFQSNVQRD